MLVSREKTLLRLANHDAAHSSEGQRVGVARRLANKGRSSNESEALGGCCMYV